MEDTEPNNLTLELGDIIEIVAPTNEDIHESSFYIKYIDNSKIKLINISSVQPHTLIIENGKITDESITQIALLSRSPVKGYAKQNGLVMKKWVNVYFSGELPVVIAGEITNVEEDMIEITTYPELDVIYIDFEYKGLPEDIPIEKIVISQKPRSLAKIDSIVLLKEDNLPEPENIVQYSKEGDMFIDIPENITPDENIFEALQCMYSKSKGIVFGEYLDTVTQMVEIPEHEKRYGVDIQLNSLNDELLSTIPNSRRTATVLNNVQLLVQRFKELREHYSKFDKNDNVRSYKKLDTYKPLVDSIVNLDKKLSWIIPVSKRIKKVYDVNNLMDADDIQIHNIEDDLDREYKTQSESYYENKVKTDDNKYASMYSQTHEFSVPFVNSNIEENNTIAFRPIQTDIQAIVSNFDDFESTTITNNIQIVKKKHVLQKYSMGLTKMSANTESMDKITYERKPMTPNDSINIKSMVYLPKPTMLFSKINTPSTSILDRANLHHSFLDMDRLLNQKKEMIKIDIQDINRDLEYENMEKENNVQFLSQITEFVMNEMEAEKYSNIESKFKRFITSITPKTEVLIRLMKKYIKYGYSLVDFVSYLEPFLVYEKNITYRDYKEIRHYIIQKMIEYNKKIDNKMKDCKSYEEYNYHVTPEIMPMMKMFKENSEIMDIFMKAYALIQHEESSNDKDKTKSELNMNSIEILNKIYNFDNGTLFCMLLSFQLISLYTPTSILGNEAQLEDMDENAKIRAPNCIQRVIAKKYTSVSDLQKDNHNSDVFYDKMYDDTPYSIMSKYKDEIKKLDTELVHEFLAENLVEKHSCPKELAPQLTSWLIEGKKRVGEGEYAILEMRPKLNKKIDENSLSEKEKEEISIESDAKMKVQYYKRIKNNWVVDNNVSEESFIDSTTLFCNIAKKCYQRNRNMDDPKTQINQCETVVDAAQRMKTIAKKKAIDEFDTRYSMSVEDLKQKLETEIKNHINRTYEMKKIQKKQLYKTNKYAYLIGSNLDNTNEILVSPNANLLELILSQMDFSKKQNDIVKFYHRFCREPMIAELNEDMHWKYCLKTNTKLLPEFLYILADVYVSGGNYKMKLDEICHSHGNIGEDGEAIVDKYSGRVIRKIDYVNEEGFNPELQQNISVEEIMAKQLNSAELEKMGKKPVLVFEDKNTQLVYNIFSNLASHVGIPIENIKDIVLRLSLEFINNPKCVNTRESYAILEAKTEKTKGKKIPPYESYFNSSVIFIVSSVFLIAIQTSIPSFTTKKTFPGCLRSFAGYPLDGIENTSGIKYISCILEKSKSSISPWDSIKKLKTDVLVDRIKIVIEKYIILNPEINELYNTKREYLLLTPDTTIPDIHNVTNWLSFNPPLISTNVSGKVPSVSKDFKSEFYNSIKESHKNQHVQLLELKSKILLYSYSVVESINSIVYKKEQLLKTSSGIPFIENACCNDDDVDENSRSNNTISYFIKEDSTILNNFKTSIELSNVVNFVKNISMAQFLFYDKNTRVQIPKIPSGFIEQNIYALVIKKCNLDNDLPIPEAFKMFMTEKPDAYDKKWSIDQKMDFFKRNGKQFDSGDMHQLMRIINSENSIEIKNKEMPQPIEMLKNIIHIFNDNNSNIIVGAFRDRMMALLETYDPNAITNEASDELRDLKNYLIRANNLMSKSIMQFLMKNSKAGSRNLSKIEQFIQTIQSWNLDIDMKESGKYYDEGLYATTNFIKHVIYDMTRVFPGIIINDVNFNHISKHWGFSQFHEADLYKYINSYYTPLEPFKNDEIFNKLLYSVKEKFTNISLLLEYIPLQTAVVKDNITKYGLFDKRSVYLIYVYCFYAILQEYILTTKDENLVIMTNNVLKQGRRNDIAKTRDVASQLVGYEEDLEENMEEEYENLEEYDIITANKEELEEKIAKLLITFLNIESNNKEIFDLSYLQISKKIRRSRDKEKKSIMGYLQNMTIEERKVENQYKQYKLDRWNVGQQKGLVIYDPKTYDRERNEMVEKDVDDIVLNMFEYGEIESRDVNQLEQEYEEDIHAMYENEGYDISHLREDYMDDYYGEEGNDDFPDD